MRRKSIESDSKKMDGRTDEVIDNSGILELDEHFFDSVPATFPPPKKMLTIRLDEDVLEWLKGQGRGYQTRINAILRAYYDAHTHGRAARS